MTQLLERDAELAALDAAVAAAADGSGRLLVIAGPAGIGKSGLLADLRERARPRLRVLSARASELEREFGFGVVRQLFEPALAARGAGAATPGGSAAGRSGASTPADSSGGPFAGAAAPAAAVFGAGAETESATSFAALHGLYWLSIDLAAERPLLLAVDDLQWCDRPSLRFLAYLARRLEGLPVLLAATLRTNEPGTDPALLAEVVHDPAAVALQPGPLSEVGVAALVEQRLGGDADPAFSAACHDATGGNPLLLRQLLRALEAERVRPEASGVELVRAVGPRAASSTVLVRLARLPAAAVAVARAVSVLGESAELPAVAALAGLDEQAVAGATGELARVEILRPDLPLGFVHPLVRDAVYLELPPGERGLLHERAARLLHESSAPAEQVAAQLLASPRRGAEWVVDVLEAAAATAMRRGAADSAVAHLRRALDEPPPAERRSGVLLALGTAEALTSGPAAAEHLRAAHDSLADPVARAHVVDGLARVLLFTGRWDEAVELTRAAAAALPPGHRELRDLLEALELSRNFLGDLTPAMTERIARNRHSGAPPPLLSMAALDWAYSGGPAAECCAFALEALERGRLIELENGLFSISAIVTLGIADRDEAVAALDASLEAAHRNGSLFSVASVHLFYGVTLFWRGDLEGAKELLTVGTEEFTTWGFGESGQVYLESHLALVALEQGDLAAARATLGHTRPSERASEDMRYWLGADLALLVAERRFEEALDTAAEIERRFGHYTSPAAGRWRAYAAEALAQLGRRDEALALAERELAGARTWGAPGALGNALRVLGLIESGASGLERLEQAAGVLDGSPARLGHAKALAALGSALRRARRPGDAREPLRRALELAVACDAPGLAEHVRSELYAAGARPRSDALAGAAALTASERRVAARAAGGETNRDIAQALFVTPKTVEVHLSNAYRKLGIRSRRELAAALG
jgi:DNA-binding CsgD family transcriptional regulator